MLFLITRSLRRDKCSWTQGSPDPGSHGGQRPRRSSGMPHSHINAAIARCAKKLVLSFFFFFFFTSSFAHLHSASRVYIVIETDLRVHIFSRTVFRIAYFLSGTVFIYGPTALLGNKRLLGAILSLTVSLRLITDSLDLF